MLGAYLDELGMQTRVTHTGEEALSIVASFRPDAALLDLGLPDMSGYDLCRRLRTLPGGGDMVVFAVTGYGQEADVRREVEAGFDRHFVKAVNLEKLMEALAREMRLKESARTAKQ
jgi:CheY-like chemotaxis protein